MHACIHQIAKLNIGPFELDFVHLRAEEYAADSRVPTARFGDIHEDALRRDLTINALYYNLHTGQCEDITGMGIQDIKQRRIRTPLPPLQTLCDDPLRAFRVIRFATRFAFRMDPDLVAAFDDIQMQDNLRIKVSKERIRVELLQTLQYDNFLNALIVLRKTKLDSIAVDLTMALKENASVCFHANVNVNVNVNANENPNLISMEFAQIAPEKFHTFGFVMASLVAGVSRGKRFNDPSSSSSCLAGLIQELEQPQQQEQQQGKNFKYSRVNSMLESLGHSSVLSNFVPFYPLPTPRPPLFLIYTVHIDIDMSMLRCRCQRRCDDGAGQQSRLQIDDIGRPREIGNIE